jgi:hypothetical protein
MFNKLSFFSSVNPNNVLEFSGHPTTNCETITTKWLLQTPCESTYYYYKYKINNYQNWLIHHQIFDAEETNKARILAKKLSNNTFTIDHIRRDINTKVCKCLDKANFNIQNRETQKEIIEIYDLNLKIKLIEKQDEVLVEDYKNEVKNEFEQLFKYPIDFSTLPDKYEFEDNSLLACYINYKLYEKQQRNKNNEKKKEENKEPENKNNIFETDYIYC